MSNRIDEFRATYKRMVDEELLELADQADQLTDEAQTALREELGHRGITEDNEEHIEGRDSDAPASGPPAEADLPQWGFFGAEAPALPPSEFVAVFSAASQSEADQVQESLRAAEIETQVQIVILVPQADAERAFEILSEHLGPDTDSDDEEPGEDLDEEIEEEAEDE